MFGFWGPLPTPWAHGEPQAFGSLCSLSPPGAPRCPPRGVSGQPQPGTGVPCFILCPEKLCGPTPKGHPPSGRTKAQARSRLCPRTLRGFHVGLAALTAQRHFLLQDAGWTRRQGPVSGQMSGQASGG